MFCPMRLLYVRLCVLLFRTRMTKCVCCGYWHMGKRWVIGWTDQLQFCWLSASFCTFITARRYTQWSSVWSSTRQPARGADVYKMMRERQNVFLWRVKKKKEVLQRLVTDVNKHKSQHQIKYIKRVPSSLFFQLHGCFSLCGYESSIQAAPYMTLTNRMRLVRFSTRILCPCGHLAHVVLWKEILIQMV